MKRILVVLGIAVIACILGCVGVYLYQMRTPPDEWIGRRLGLSGEALSTFTEAHNRYNATCNEMCVKIRNSDAHLATIVLNNRELNPEIGKAMALSDGLRIECRHNMLKHFYEVAAMLDEPKREEYLNLVLPLIIEPELMSKEHSHP